MSKINGITSVQWEILEHRLGVPEAIADALKDTYGWSWIAVEERAYQIWYHGRKEIIWDCKVDREIIKDALDGSTYFAMEEEIISEGEQTRSQIEYRKKVGQQLAEQLGTNLRDS